MGLAELTQSHGWKNFMAKLYGIGASVVIVGALFKIMHWPGAGIMLTLGLGVEAIIFFFSAFEPLHEEDDWSLVFPILGGAGKADEVPVEYPTPVGGMNSAMNTGKNAKKNEVAAISTDSITKFNEMLEKANEKGVFEKFGESLNGLNDKVAQLSDISDATLATTEYTNSMKKASGSVNELSNSFNKSAESVNKSTGELEYSISTLSDSYQKSSQKVTEANEVVVASYKRIAGSMDFDFSELKEGNKAYSAQLGTLNKNLSALNAIFELQLNEADLDKMMDDLNKSVEESSKYSKEIIKLRENLQALNTIYGNMLTAMNYKA